MTDDTKAPVREDGRAWRDFQHRWHVAVNRYSADKMGAGFPHVMYEAKSAAEEVQRLPLLFAKERRGELAQRHHQCSHDHQGQDVPDNHLTCCLGVECRQCPMLAAIEAGELSPEEKDQAKAWTCVAHILTKGGDVANEGYVLTTDDRMYWDNLHASLAEGLPE
jgi:hypothetical protein